VISVPRRPAYILVHEPITPPPVHSGYLLLVIDGYPVFSISLRRDNQIGYLSSLRTDHVGLYVPPDINDLVVKKVGELRRRLERKR